MCVCVNRVPLTRADHRTRACRTAPGCALPPHLKAHAKEWPRLVLEEYVRQPPRPFDRTALHVKFLEIGRVLPFYGATFFLGEVEPPPAKSSWLVFRERTNEVVRIGINFDGIHVFDARTNAVRLSLAYDELKYNSYHVRMGCVWSCGCGRCVFSRGLRAIVVSLRKACRTTRTETRF